MTFASPDNVHAALQWRYATKKFDASRKIDDAHWNILEKCLVLTPSSYGMQPWKFFVVTDPAVKERLPQASWGQTQPKDCSHMVVLANRTDAGPADVDRLVERTALTRGTELGKLAGFRKMVVGFLEHPQLQTSEWAAKQVYIALGQFMACAAMLGIDTCPMEGIEPAKYDEILGIQNQGYQTCVGCAAGYRADDDKYAQLAKVRFPVEEVIGRI
ncbi:MAG: NAD(P)H-dependent oxidoreductase [Planctomycetes bacterium]|nr:NAD(P)H-dependent oxidoreductase [Planctomycetota bacterium]